MLFKKGRVVLTLILSVKRDKSIHFRTAAEDSWLRSQNGGVQFVETPDGFTVFFIASSQTVPKLQRISYLLNEQLNITCELNN